MFIDEMKDLFLHNLNKENVELIDSCVRILMLDSLL